jgi:GNAT superfamily N-acetyltransferase
MLASLGEYSFFRLSNGYRIKDFNCNDNDLNDFFYNEAMQYSDQLLTVTYVLETHNKTIGFFSVANDKLQFTDNKPVWNRLNRKIIYEKRRKTYPAVKLGRLGIDKDFQSKGIGSQILDFTERLFIAESKSGCRFITVDAYNNDKTLSFYRRNDFEFFLTTDTRDKTRLMYYDLLPLKNTCL